MIARLTSLLQWAVGIDPMMRKESCGFSRRWQTFAGRALFVLVMAIVVWAAWEAFGVRGGQTDYSTLAGFGRDLFVLFSMFQYYIIGLSALSLSSDMISKEVRGGTLGILAITPLTAWKIVLGKWKFCVGYLLITLLSGIPILSLGLYFGGVSAEVFLAASTLTLATLMMCAAWGLLVSSYLSGSHLNVPLSILGMAAYGLVPLLALRLIDFLSPNELYECLCWVEPPYSITVTIIDRGLSLGSEVAEYSWMTSSGISLLLALLFLAMAARRVRKVARTEPRQPIVRRAFESLDRAFERWSFGIRLWTERGGVWESNPFLWKELRSRVEGKFRYFVRILMGVLVLFAFVSLALGADLMDNDTVVVIYAVLMILLFLTAIGTGCGAFTREKEGRRWEILRTAPVKAGHVVMAKLAGSALGTAPFVALMVLIAALVISVVELRRGGSLAPPVIATLVFTFFTISAGMMFSLLVGTTRKAFGLTLGTTLFFVAVIPVLIALTQTGYYRHDFDEFLLNSTNPFAHLQWIEGRHPDRMMTGFLVFTGLYAAMGIGCLLTCKVRFDRLMGRRPNLTIDSSDR